MFDREKLKQDIVYASIEAQRLSFRDRLRLIKRVNQPFLKRFGKAAVGSLAKLVTPVPTEISEDFQPFCLIDNGWEQVVYSSDTAVLKVNFKTLTKDKAKAERAAERSRYFSEECKRYLGNFWPDIDYGVMQYMPGLYAVKSIQPKLEITKLFAGVPELLGYSDSPGFTKQLEDLLQAIKTLNQETGIYPDILGSGNIALARDAKGSERLIFLDTQSASPEIQENRVTNRPYTIGDEIDRQLSIWEEHLELISRGQYESREPALN